ncbi:hypothetical protein GTY41_03855 [Streptomyces sp. SID685]|uniref:hypothetical protein n=1 Tax=Streptomyces sp. SID685 TaxID=2690322 RepID=UPI001371A55E|nr:hypothetical protein [Streptomyces sp. SID685]MYR84100.1 hypothetical protein [Streptomyces sp. SID685]
MGAARRIQKRLGRRGSILAGIGTMELVYGLQVVIDPRYGVVRGVGVLTHLRPMPWWGVLWMLCGAAALVLAFEPKPKWDRWGFAAAWVPMEIWSLANLVAWLSGDFHQAWTSAVTWGVWAYIVTAINRWPEYYVRGNEYGA